MYINYAKITMLIPSTGVCILSLVQLHQSNNTIELN